MIRDLVLYPDKRLETPSPPVEEFDNGDLQQLVADLFESMVLDSEIPVLVDFWAPWRSPCRTIASTIEELAREYAGRIKFVKVNVDEGQRTAMSLGVRNIPALILFTHGKPIDRQVGVQPKAILNDMINPLLFKHPSWAPE